LAARCPVSGYGFHSRASTYVRPLLEVACQIWSPKYRYQIDKIESVQIIFSTRKLHGLSNLSDLDRLHVLGLETLEHRRLVHDLILCYKYLHGLIDTDNRNFWCVQMSPRNRNNGLKLHRVSKNVPPLACYTFDAREWILTFFGRNVTDKVGNQKTLYYATLNNLCFCTTWQNGET